VKEVESYLRARLADVPQIASVRGLGLLLGIEFTNTAAPIHQALLEKRIITGTSSDPRVLRLLPPLCLQREEVDLFVETLKQVTEDR
jgi:acetylornithine/succinyldiaminopimelate/putrescine aminotransferase